MNESPPYLCVTCGAPMLTPNYCSSCGKQSTDLRNAIVTTAVKLDDCLDEFEGDDQFCQEHRLQFENAVHAYKNHARSDEPPAQPIDFSLSENRGRAWARRRAKA